VTRTEFYDDTRDEDLDRIRMAVFVARHLDLLCTGYRREE
jgi:hypothetical protein